MRRGRERSGEPGAEPADSRESAGVVASCPRCGGAIRFARGAWRCESCAFSLAGSLMGRELAVADLAELLTKGRTRRLHGFRQKRSGAYCKAAFVLGEDGRLAVDFTKSADEASEPVPEGGPPAAFGGRVDCPLCVGRGSFQPGYVVAGREAWGCSAWREGCPLRVPFVVEGKRLRDTEVRRLFGRQRATLYLKGFATRGRPARIVLAEFAPGWKLEDRSR